MKSRPAGAEVFHVSERANGLTDVTKKVVAFWSFLQRA